MTGSVPESLAGALADRYRIERAIGQGGMATVYQATDVKHGRRVAVKVLRSDLAASVGSDRFLREITIAAQLQHPHILLLIDSGEAGGHLYYVMPLIEGGSPRTRLETREAIAVDEVIRLARQVSDALDYAHRNGLVHRDIKPENILLNDGLAVVADFGIAKALTEATDRSLTRTGFPLGTVGYMSPEQAAGFTALDARSDVFSLACVIYELLVGRVPGMWPSDESLRVQRFLEAPADHRRQLDLLPAAAEQVLVRGLALRPEQRYPGPKQMVDDLVQAFRERPRFDESQVRNIVARASVLEATAVTADGGLTLGGIQRLAAEVGIPPQHVDRAAKELQRNSPSSPPATFEETAFTSQPRIVVERWIEGDVPDDEYPVVVDEVRMTVGNVGQASVLGRSLAWRTVSAPMQSGVRNVSLLVTPSQGRTRLRIEESLTTMMGGYYGGILGGGTALIMPGSMGLAIAAFGTPLLIPVFLAAGYGGAWVLARKYYRRARSGSPNSMRWPTAWSATWWRVRAGLDRDFAPEPGSARPLRSGLTPGAKTLAFKDIESEALSGLHPKPAAKGS
ncbi:MAG: serine/threonine-protein kinase [Gemmatimonadales bacterium]